MMSKTIVCVLLLNVVALSLAKPSQYPEGPELRHKAHQIRVEDTSSDESLEKPKDVKIMASEYNYHGPQHIKNAPYRQPIYHSHQVPQYMYGQQERQNERGYRRGNDEVDSEENNSQAYRNQINRH